MVSKKANKVIEIFTDGACSGNPGPGGWGAILRFNGHEKELQGGERETTNNRMELTAVIEALKAVKESCMISLTTDSEYVRKGITEWLPGWKRNGWKTAAKKPVANRDLWEQLETLAAGHQMAWHWVRGHNEHPENERCDELARQAIRALRDEDY